MSECRSGGVAETKTEKKKKRRGEMTRRSGRQKGVGRGRSTEPSKEQINRNGTLKQT